MIAESACPGAWAASVNLCACARRSGRLGGRGLCDADGLDAIGGGLLVWPGRLWASFGWRSCSDDDDIEGVGRRRPLADPRAGGMLGVVGDLREGHGVASVMVVPR